MDRKKEIIHRINIKKKKKQKKKHKFYHYREKKKNLLTDFARKYLTPGLSQTLSLSTALL